MSAPMNKDSEKGEVDGYMDENASEALQPSKSVSRGQKRMQQTQAQVTEVTEIMRANIDKVLERDCMISALDERADALKEGAEMFEKQAGALKSRFWYENMKMMAILGATIFIFLMILFIFIFIFIFILV